MIAAQLDANGVVLNTIVLDDMSQAPTGYVECPEWVGIGLHINTPQPSVVEQVSDPVAKLRDFLAANPDVASLLK